MSRFELLLIAIGLSMDAFAVAICKGLSVRKCTLKSSVTVGLYFGFFQAAMPLIGYLVGYRFSERIQSFDHWIAFGLLSLIGINMIRESMQREKSEAKCDLDALKFSKMIVLAFATSIDAFAAGVTFAFLKVDIVPAVLFIGLTTLIISMIGVNIGNIFGLKYKSKAEFTGGIILVLMGVKVLLEHMGVIGF